MSPDLGRAGAATLVARGSTGAARGAATGSADDSSAFMTALSAAEDVAVDPAGIDGLPDTPASVSRVTDKAEPADPADPRTVPAPVVPVDNALLLAQSGFTLGNVTPAAREADGNAASLAHRGPPMVNGISGSAPAESAGPEDATVRGTTLAGGAPLPIPDDGGAAPIGVGPRGFPSQRPVLGRGTAERETNVGAWLKHLAPATMAVPSGEGLPVGSTQYSDEFGRAGQRKSERGFGLFSLDSSASGSAVAPSSSPLFTPVDAASANAGVGIGVSQDAMTGRLMEQLSWWLAQKVQGADFKIDMPGGQPVSVSVQVRGNEAQVAFRTDQPEVRQILGEAMAQLKQLFGSEGLVLAGVSVGGNSEGYGHGGGGSEAARHRFGGSAERESQVDLEPSMSAAGIGRGSAGSSGRALDLYV